MKALSFCVLLALVAFLIVLPIEADGPQAEVVHDPDPEFYQWKRIFLWVLGVIISVLAVFVVCDALRYGDGHDS